MSTARRRLGRVHIWVGWFAAVPLLIWTVSGLWMVARPIDQVRGEHLVAKALPIRLPPSVTPPRVGARVVSSIKVEVVGGRAAWVVAFADGGARAADLATGAWLPAPTRTTAISAARRHLLSPANVSAVTLTPADAPPIDLRRPRPAWRVSFADGARVYVDAETGGVLALRTRQWRLFDFMWGLHILAPRGREDSSHAVLIGAAVLALLTVVAGTILLPLGRRRKLPGIKSD